MLARVQRFAETLFGAYAHTVIQYPKTVTVLVLFISTLLSAYAVYFHGHAMDFDPVKGFETRGTDLSAARLTLDAIKHEQTSSEKILRWFYESQVSRRKRRVWRSNPTTTEDKKFFNNTLQPTYEPITVNYDDYGVNAEPGLADLVDACESFASLGKDIPYDVVEYLAKIFVRVKSYDQLFSVDTLKHLCRLDDVIEETMQLVNFTNQAANLHHSFNLPLYTTCPNLTTANQCDQINQNDVANFRKWVDLCRQNGSEPICTTAAINHVVHFLLPKQPDQQATPTFAVVLRVMMSNGQNRKFYELLESNIREFLAEHSGLELVGVAFNLKNQIFVDKLFQDAVLASVSALLVFACFLFYSRSLVFTVIIVLIVVLSTGVAFFIYTVILGIDFFPFINLLVIVLLVSIGADDAFLLLVYLRHEVKKMSNLEYKVGTIYVPLYRRTDLVSRSLRTSLHHSLASMFVTSLTTAVAFLTNLTSPIIVLRCFGIFACTTILVNYALVLLVLPAAIVLTSPVRTVHSRFRVSKLGEMLAKVEFAGRLAELVHNLRFPIVVASILLSAASGIVVLYYPGMQLPRYNPTRLLVASNPHEYFDDHLHLYDFQWKRSSRIVKNFVFGISQIEKQSALSPYKKPTLPQANKRFNLTREKLSFYKNVAMKEASRDHVNYHPWAQLALADNVTCFQQKPIPSNCVLQFSAGKDHLPHQFPDDFAVLPGDAPLIDHDFAIRGYFISIPTSERLRIDGDATEKIFKEIEQTCAELRKQSEDPVMCLSSAEITRYYDIIAQIRSSSLSAVAVSVIVCLLVIILCTRIVLLSIHAIVVITFVIFWTIAALVLLGWQLSVVESTILVITIGLSFDYTLHYTVSMRESRFLTIVERIRTTNSTAGVACLLGAITLLLTGTPLLFAQTAAFFQVGTMLVVLGVTSVVGAAIVFPAFVAVFSISCSNEKVTRM